MVDLTETQKEILQAEGHQLVTGGPGSGKTTVSILKAAKIAHEDLKPGQHILFLSFARATVSRVLEAIDEESAITREERRRIEVDTYHSFFLAYPQNAWLSRRLPTADDDPHASE